MSRARPAEARRTFADDLAEGVVADDAESRGRKLLAELAVGICELGLEILGDGGGGPVSGGGHH